MSRGRRAPHSRALFARVSGDFRRSHSRRGPARAPEWRNHSQINPPHIFPASRAAAEFPPSRQRIPHPPQSQRPRKIIPTPRRHHQHRQPQPHQLPQMPVNRPIAAENQNHIGILARARHAHRASRSFYPPEMASAPSENIPAREWQPRACNELVREVSNQTTEQRIGAENSRSRARSRQHCPFPRIQVLAS